MPETYRKPIREADVEGGHIRAVVGGNTVVSVFKGIPYAAPPVGENRWKAPQPVIPWEGTRACVEFGPAAWQLDRTLEVGAKELYPAPYEVSEDCLSINVWTSAQSTAEKQPVLFWTHGGGNFGGYGHEIENDGEGLAARGVVVVTYNYRLGPLGFLAHPELSAESPNGVSGNYAILDALKALTWVRENIAAFGGDPDNITIGGQSAGARMTQILMTSPLAKGMFTKAVIHSGARVGATDARIPTKTLNEAEQEGVELMKALGCSSIADMRALTPKQLFGEERKFYSGNVDGYVLPKPSEIALEDGDHPDIPYIVLSTADEMVPLGYRQVLNAGNQAFCENQLKLGRTPAYAFRFSRFLPGDEQGAYHTSELFYLFETVKRSWRPMTGYDYELSVRMADYWANFIKTGNPNGEGLPVWIPYTEQCKKAMDLGDNNSMMEIKLIAK